jgi:hypothetical protein
MWWDFKRNTHAMSDMRLNPKARLGRTPRAVIQCARVNITKHIQTTLAIQAFIIRGLAYTSKWRFCFRAMIIITVPFTAEVGSVSHAQCQVGAGAPIFHVVS